MSLFDEAYKKLTALDVPKLGTPVVELTDQQLLTLYRTAGGEVEVVFEGSMARLRSKNLFGVELKADGTYHVMIGPES
jgi:hypothetical protein